ncbi:MAG: tyrosinase family protein [Pelagimonas sp.]|uniref:tyrosinase family protein n=1 Tax=Pelagimonas sp. TaxID=2073170 RepID=UPI003D6AD3AF
MAGTRQDIASLDGPWSDTMIWYARAVGAARSLDLNVTTSWTYLAAIHGMNPQGWIDQNIIPASTAVPSQQEMRLMFNQCQHAGWFFLPWHRGYLAAFEEILGAWIAAQGGPADWALPYWNYLNASDPNARNIPQEFLDATIPGDNVPNPLAQATRGPLTTLGPVPWTNGTDISLVSQSTNSVYTAIPGTLGYGGPISGFNQSGNAYGAIENNPHNFVHVMIGGDNSPQPAGWMYDPDFAALDPIFWVHHCNIDRLWAAWMTDANNGQEASIHWRNGPFPRQFTMPSSTANLVTFTPEDTLPGARLAPTYDNLSSGTGIAPTVGVAMATASQPSGRASSLIGANAAPLSITDTEAVASLSFSPTPPPVALALAAAPKERLYLNVEGVRGIGASGVVTVRVSAPASDDAFSETIAFFGLGKATSTEGPHAGNGLSATIEITDKVRDMQGQDGATITELEVRLAQSGGSSSEITVDRLSLFSLR